MFSVNKCKLYTVRQLAENPQDMVLICFLSSFQGNLKAHKFVHIVRVVLVRRDETFQICIQKGK